MKRIFLMLFSAALTFNVAAQENEKPNYQGHTDQNKFRQLKDVLPTPNDQHNAAGAPGHQYTQQKVDYVMDLRIDESTNRLYGEEKITYHNNSKDHLEYLWLQLDQNVRAADSKTPDIGTERLNAALNGPNTFTNSNLKKPFDGGFKIEYVKNEDGSDLSHTINQTMMRINLSKPLAPGEIFKLCGHGRDIRIPVKTSTCSPGN